MAKAGVHNIHLTCPKSTSEHFVFGAYLHKHPKTKAWPFTRFMYRWQGQHYSVLVPAGLHCRAILLQWGPLGWGKQSSGEHHAGGRELLASWNLVKLPEGQTKSKAYSHRIQARVPGPRPYARCCQAPQETNTAQAATGPRNTGDSALGLWSCWE